VNWLLLIATYPIFNAARNRWRGAAKFAACSATGLLTVIGLVVLYFWRRGGLPEFVDNVFVHNLKYIGAVGTSERLEYCLGTLTILARTQALVWAFAVLGLVALFRSSRDTAAAIFLGGWLITSAIGVSASGYFFPHYFQQLLPPLALAAAAGAERFAAVKFWKAIPVWGRRTALTVLLTALPTITLWPFLFTYTPAEAVRKIYPGNFFAEMPEFARGIETVTPPEARVFIFGAEPELLFYAHRPSATRYIFLFPLYGPYGKIREKQLAATREVEHARPSTAVYLPNALFFVAGTDQYFTDWTRSYMEHNFYVNTLLIADEFGAAQMLNVATDVPADVSSTREQVIGAILVRQSREAP
jgi:hypothetical protein